jgi:DNA-binding transcriptional LysR family regulator
MSQSGASHALKGLECQVGSPLFIREREGLRLTQTGQRLLPYLEAALSNLDAAHAEIADLGALRSGALRVAAVPSLLATVLPPLLREYSIQFPGIELSIFEGTDDEVRSWVINGLAHVGFAALPVDGVCSEEIAQDEWLALLPEQVAGSASNISLKQLARHKFLLSGGGCEAHILRLFAIANITIGENFLIKQLPTIQAMVAQNLGVSLVPSLSVKELRGCRGIPLKPRAFRRIGMLSSSVSVSTPAIDTWRKLVRDRIGLQRG